MKTVLIAIGIILALALALLVYACIVVGGRAERQLHGEEREG